MLLGESNIQANSSSDVVAAAAASDEGVGPNSGGEQKGRIQFGGTMTSRWPREETLALIKIRSEMDVAFRDSSAKGPLWEEISRKLAGLGYHRSGKKCREKFENIYKYHKRTKDVRPSPNAAAAAAAAPHPSGKSKTYRFFDQLEAIDSNPTVTSLVSVPPVMQNFPFPVPALSAPPNAQQSSNNFSSSMIPQIGNPSYLPAAVSADTTSSSTYSDQDLQLQHGPGNNERENKSEKKKRRRRRKKKKSEWMEMFEKLMREVARKQEELQKNLFDVIERRERERLIREEAWRAQEAARINHECEMLARDRSAAAAKDNAVISFLQRIADQQQKVSVPREKSRDGDNNVVGNRRNLSSLQQTVVQFSASLPSAVEGTTKLAGVGTLNVELERVDNGEKNSGSSSRWPRAEVEALIKLRTNSQTNYGENTTKGPLWEEISAAMKKLGYNRNPKRCKEKWENINKYFKKVKESNKKRREDSKTCPYFQLLDEIYNQKVGKINDTNFFLSFRSSDSNNNGGSFSAPTPPLMVTPEQQWPPLVPPHPTSEQELGVGDDDCDYDDDDGDGDGDYDGEGLGEEKFEVVASKV